MSHSLIRPALCVLLVVLAGCVGGGFPISQDVERETTSTEICLPETRGDPAIPRCLVEKRPPNLEYRNLDNKEHNLSVRITRNDSTVVFSRNRTVQPDFTDGWDDVIDSPGTYTITATVDNESTATYTVDLDRRWTGDGEAEWEIRISSGGNVEIQKIPHQ